MAKIDDVWGPLKFRFFLSERDRHMLTKADATDAGWKINPDELASESLTFQAELTGSERPEIRPIFPGAMRFAIRPEDIGKANQPIVAPNGVINEATLKLFAGIEGTLIVSMVPQSQLKEAAKRAAIDLIDEAPTHAWYSKVVLSKAFLSTSLLNHRKGLLASPVEGIIQPGGDGWQEKALRGFLFGNYLPILRASSSGDITQDDAQRLPMPMLALDPVKRTHVRLNITLGWSRKYGIAPTDPRADLVEVIPTRLFLQHVANELVDIKNASDHETVKAVLRDSYDTSAWVKQLNEDLGTLGFASLSNEIHPTSFKLREFQIAAKADFVASQTPATPRGSSRDLRNLACARNPTPYKGVPSGRANQETRKLVQDWLQAELRNPLLIFPIDMNSIDNAGRPRSPAVPLTPDLWLRYEYKNSTPRVFAADISSLARSGAKFDISKAEPIGWVVAAGPYRGGPTGLDSDRAQYTPNPQSEFTPEHMLGMPWDSLFLLTPKQDAQAELRRKRMLSTFKVIRAIAEQECRAYLDEVNAYDPGYLSIGLYHWAASGAGKNPTGGTELGGVIAYLPYFDKICKTHSASVFDDNGIASRLNMMAKQIERFSNPTPLLKYDAPLLFLTDRNVGRNATTKDITEFLPSWRSFYRQIQAARRDTDLPKAFYQVAKRRLRDIRRSAFPLGIRPTDRRSHPNNTPTVGSVFTSELLIAQIARWHVNRPEAVIDKTGAPSEYLIAAYLNAASTGPVNETEWEDALYSHLGMQLDQFIKDMGNDKEGNPRYGRLRTDFNSIENPKWIYLANGVPTVDQKNNSRHYSLDPRLRWVWRLPNSFMLDDNIVGPLSSVDGSAK